MRRSILVLMLAAGCGRLHFDEGPPRTLVLGDEHVCERRPDATLACWGQNDQGQLGDGTTKPKGSPLVVPGITVAEVALGQNHTCALDLDGALYCWGQNTEGEAGCGASCAGMPRITSPHPANDGRTYKHVAANNFMSCAIAIDGELYCWGQNTAGELGVGDVLPRAEPTHVAGARPWIAIGIGNDDACGIQDDLSVWCWGDANNGALGDGQSMVNALVPQRALVDGATYIDAGGNYACVLVGPEITCWGGNGTFQLGDIDTSNHKVPMPIGRRADVLAIGNGHVCTINGTLLSCWGDNAFGELGTGDPGTARPNAVQIAGAWSEVAAGKDFTCARARDGAIWCWGRNESGQLGDGTMTDSPVPVRVR